MKAVATRPLGLVTFIGLVIIGLFYVKWSPYYNRAFVAAASHSIGSSILSGRASAPPPASFGTAIEYAFAYGKAIWQAMVLGLLLGSAIQALLPTDLVARILGAARPRRVLVGGLLACPAMMCTCCAAPVVVGLRRRWASPGAAIAFWLGNPVLNPATLVFTGFVLGWHWTALRLVLGIVLVFGVGWLADRLASPTETETAEDAVAVSAKGSAAGGPFRRWLAILWDMSIRLVPEYLVLVLVLGAARAWLFPMAAPDIDNSLVWIVALSLAGTIFVIPTAGEVPIIQAMLALGVGVGPAAALMMTLPPVSLPSIAMLARSFQGRMLAMVVAAVIAIGIVAGFAAVALKF